MVELLKPDICVIGAGSGGLSVAAAAAAFGVSVTLIEKGKMGGECLYTGGVPSKALIAVAKRVASIDNAAAFGLVAQRPKIKFADVHRRVENVIAAIAPNDSQERFTALGVRVIAPAGAAAGLLAARGLSPAPFEAYDALRLELGVPDGSRDLLVEKALLLENGFDELNGVDWQKGCYMGQELTARTKYRALIRKRLLPVKIEGTLPPPGTSVVDDGQEVGEMRSGSGGRGLALLRLDAVKAGHALQAGDAKIVPQIPAWMRLAETTEA